MVAGQPAQRAVQARAVERTDLRARTGQRRPQRAGAERAEPVVDDAHVDPGLRLRCQRGGELPADVVVAHDVVLEQDRAFGAADGGEPRGIVLRGVLQQAHRVAFDGRRSRGARECPIREPDVRRLSRRGCGTRRAPRQARCGGSFAAGRHRIRFEFRDAAPDARRQGRTAGARIAQPAACAAAGNGVNAYFTGKADTRRRRRRGTSAHRRKRRSGWRRSAADARDVVRLFDQRVLYRSLPRDQHHRDEQHACVAAGNERPKKPPGREHDSCRVRVMENDRECRPLIARPVPSRHDFATDCFVCTKASPFQEPGRAAEIACKSARQGWTGRRASRCRRRRVTIACE